MALFSFLDRSGSRPPPPPDPNAQREYQQQQPASSYAPAASTSTTTETPTTIVPSSESLFATPAYDPAALHPLASLSKASGGGLEYLTLEDDKTNLEGGKGSLGNRGFWDDVQTGTGTAYVAGGALGAVLGGLKGWSQPATSLRLRWNATLNAGGARGMYYSNSAAVLAIFYNVSNNIIPMLRPDGKQDLWSSMGAAAFSGALWNAGAGRRPMIAGAGVMAGGAAAWNYAKTLL